ncbi:MAG: NUDIX domain-containing protein [Acidimicrobiia bacterium]
MREWLVGGAIIMSSQGLLLVHNKRRNGRSDWSPPGGVIDEGENLIEGLAREVFEETGLTVNNWLGPLYRLETVAPDMGWRMRFEAHLAIGYEGDLRIDDPDGIVIDADWVHVEACSARLATNHPWVREPLEAWLEERWDDGRWFNYHVHGAHPGETVVKRM